MTDDTPLPAGSVGMAVSGPTIDPPAGLAVSFDGFPVEDLLGPGRSDRLAR